MTPRRRAALALATTSLAAFGLAACATADEPADTTDESTTPETSTTDDAATGTSAYADGTYTADGSYTSPGGEETITVTVTLADGVIEDVEVTNDETTNPNSLRYQGEFIDGIAAEVVGVPLDDVSVDRVGGSSLTSGGFEDALETIRDEAAA
ncbi:FMN-binding protein [Agrococcus jejuensis]|uniref:FMN-binding domain-containing protein n=1 Tax=Agrococcus jejuensis TaxID=399736 RepID=A0A1G8BBU4_9MICO|nr:FMN-binding protein [Agrococcus jejuensis]SDH30571.1 FMN-binding domain-containing protein [Agrococcus jejuensis]